MNDDLISRQAAFEALCNATFGCADIDVCKKGDRYCAEGAKLDELPAAQPEQKKGKWLDGGMKGVYYCSECKHKIMTNVYVDQRPLWKYCPNCGSYNGGEDE